MSYNGPLPQVVNAGGTGDASFTAYSVVCGGTTAAGNLQNVSGVGTTGQALISNGAAALPTWKKSANLVEISSQTASNVASIVFTSGITTTYNNYMLLSTNVLPVTNTQQMQVLISTNGGSSYLATGYTSGALFFPSTSATPANNNASTFFFGQLGTTSSSGNGGGSSSVIHLLDMTKAATSQWPKTIGYGVDIITATVYGGLLVGGNVTAIATAVNAIQVLFGSGNISTGTFTLYGILE